MFKLISKWLWIMDLFFPLFHHNEYFYCYKLEIVIQQKWQRPHIFIEHLVLQLQWTRILNHLHQRDSTEVAKPFLNCRLNGDEERNRSIKQQERGLWPMELCGFFAQAPQHSKMLTLHVDSQKITNYYHLSPLKPHTHPKPIRYPIHGTKTQ